MRISIIVPAYNEEKRIVGTISNLIKEMQTAGISDYEIIIAIDGEDKTNELVNNIASNKIKIIKNGMRMGKGSAINAGFEQARGTIVGFVDADEAVLASVAVAMAGFLEKNRQLCGVVGSRRIEKASLRKPGAIRRVFSLAFNVLVRMLLGLRYYDTQCGAKFFRRELAKKALPFRTRGFSIDAEMLYRLQKYGPIFEYPVDWSSKQGSRFSLHFVPSMFIEVLRIRAADR